MSAWQVSGQGQALPPLPFGLRIAGMGVRLGAWFLDLIFFAVLSLIPLAGAVASGGVALNPVAMRQVEGNPYLQPTVPWLVVNTGPLIASTAVWVVLAIGYAAACWALFRGLPGQRLVSLQVAHATTGKNLSPWQATWRAVLVNGIPAAATAATIVAACELLARIIPADYGGNAGYLAATENTSWGGLLSLAGVAGWAWPLLLLISTAADRDKRGIHDKLAGSVVVGRGIAPGAWGHPYGPTPRAPYGYPYGPGPGDPYHSQPGAPGQPPTWPAVYPWPPAPRTEPGQDAATPAQAENAADNSSSTQPADDGSSGDATSAAPAEQRPPAGWPGVIQSGEPTPTWADQPPAAGGAEPAKRRPVSDNPQVFGARLPAGLRVAGFNRRVAAYLLDTVLVILLFGGIATVVIGNPNPSATPPPERLVMLAGLISGLAQAAYFVGTWRFLRGSIGQKVVGLQVGDESTGHPLSLADSLVRWALLQGPVALYLAVPDVLRGAVGITAIGWIWLLMYSARRDPDGRGYHDRIAHSLVVEQG